jgi:surface carbohydrate biosynthesis protein
VIIVTKVAYLEVQIPVRDLDARLLLGHRLTSLGFDVIIGRTRQVFSAALMNRGGIYFTDFGFTKAGAKKVKALKERDIETFLFCEEVLAVARWDTYQVERVDSEALQLSSKVLLNNEIQKDIILDKFNRDYNFLNIGNCRFDLLEAQYRDIYASRINKIQEKYGKFILVCTNGAVGDVENLGRRISVEGFKNALINQEVIGVMALQKYFIIELLKLAKLRKDLVFVIRAKPGEEIAIKKLVPIDLENVFFDCTDNIRPWVMSATHVVSNCCSTALDAVAAGVPSITFQPKGWCEIKAEVTDFVSYETNTIEELSKALDTIEQIKPISKIEAERYFPNLNQSTTDVLVSLLDKSTMASGSFVYSISYATLRYWIWFLKRKYFTSHLQWTGLINFKEIIHVISKLDDIKNQRTSIKRIGAEIYLIKSKTNTE